MGFYNKLKWVLGFLMVFVLIIATNIIDKNNFIRVKDSVVTIYEDRLIANDLIFEMSKAVQEKEVAAILADSLFFSQRNAKINNDLDGFVSRFEETKLTVQERSLLGDLKQNIAALKKSEVAFVGSGFDSESDVVKHISGIQGNLYDLSKIQLSEGGRQMSISQKTIDTVELFTQIEIYLLVFLAIVIQRIVMYKPKEEG